MDEGLRLEIDIRALQARGKEQLPFRCCVANGAYCSNGIPTDYHSWHVCDNSGSLARTIVSVRAAPAMRLAQLRPVD